MMFLLVNHKILMLDSCLLLYMNRDMSKHVFISNEIVGTQRSHMPTDLERGWCRQVRQAIFVAQNSRNTGCISALDTLEAHFNSHYGYNGWKTFQRHLVLESPGISSDVLFSFRSRYSKLWNQLLGMPNAHPY